MARYPACNAARYIVVMFRHSLFEGSDIDPHPPFLGVITWPFRDSANDSGRICGCKHATGPSSGRRSILLISSLHECAQLLPEYNWSSYIYCRSVLCTFKINCHVLVNVAYSNKCLIYICSSLH